MTYQHLKNFFVFCTWFPREGILLPTHRLRDTRNIYLLATKFFISRIWLLHDGSCAFFGRLIVLLTYAGTNESAASIKWVILIKKSSSPSHTIRLSFRKRFRLRCEILARYFFERSQSSAVSKSVKMRAVRRVSRQRREEV